MSRGLAWGAQRRQEGADYYHLPTEPAAEAELRRLNRNATSLRSSSGGLCFESLKDQARGARGVRGAFTYGGGMKCENSATEPEVAG